MNFTEPDPMDNGVQHAKMISEGKVNPLIFIQNFEEFLEEQLGTADIGHLKESDWLTMSEHRLLSLTRGSFFTDDLNIQKRLESIKYYPEHVRRYLIASNWDIIATEQAFVKRCADVGDEPGSIIICARIAERLMRLCFLYKKAYAPYSKWFGTAFGHLDVNARIKEALHLALRAEEKGAREKHLVEAQALVAELHNESGITAPVSYQIESYYGRDIQVIFADKFSEAVSDTLKGTVFEEVPLIGSFSQMGGLSEFSDEKRYYTRMKNVYGGGLCD